jgi:hypothetical protein
MYNNLQKKYSFSIPFDSVIAMIYEENRSSPGDVMEALIKKGIPEEALFVDSQLFQDMWNFFPHKVLNNKSPIESFQEMKKNK